MITDLAKKLVDNTVVKLALYIQRRLEGYTKPIDSVYTNNVREILWEKAAIESSIYVEKHLSEVLLFPDRQAIRKYLIEQLATKKGGACLEFGVFQGESINFLSKRLPQADFFGFDSFEGLAEDWIGTNYAKGFFNVDGHLPAVNPNVKLIKGWFDVTLPKFALDHPDADVLLMHIDGDTYEAASIVLTELRCFIKPGLFILFDEYLSYPNWENGEFAAWRQFCDANKVKYRYRAFSTQQALVEVV